MREQILFELKSLYRDGMKIKGYVFGQGEDSACVVGAMRGNEIQPLYICSQLVKTLGELEEAGQFLPGKSVMVVPAVNSYSLNIGKRFWPTDNTDINRMFPGYHLGETTQRIAAGLFDRIQTFQHGIQFGSFYMQGHFIPHVRIMQTGYESIPKAHLFGLPYVVLRQPKPYDTATLNYNWQIWNTHAFSVFASAADQLHETNARMAINAVLRFLRANEILKEEPEALVPASGFFTYEALVSVRSTRAGIFKRLVHVHQDVRQGQQLALIVDPYTGEVVEEILAPLDGRVFFVQSDHLAFTSSTLFKLIPLHLA